MNKSFLDTTKVNLTSKEYHTLSKGNILRCNFECPLLGHRYYTHGSSMIDGLIKSACLFIGCNHEKIFINSFKIIKEFSSFFYIDFMNKDSIKEYVKPSKVKAKIEIQNDNITYIGFVYESDKEITNIIKDYNSAEYVYNVSSQVNNQIGYFKHVHDNIDLIRALNEVNRQITIDNIENETLKKQVRWAYIENFQLINFKGSQIPHSIKYQKINEVTIGQHKFEIKKGSIFTDKECLISSFDICFFIQL